MTGFSRSALTDFDFGSPIYAGATVTAYTVDNFGNKTAFLATLYADLTSTTLLQNPQTLDGFGQWQQPVYIDNSVVLTISGAEGVPDHQTGVISANLAGSSAADAAASASSAAASFGMSSDLYARVRSIYQKTKSQVFPTPLVALNMLRVKAGAAGYELRTPAQVQADLGLGFGAGLKSDGAGNIAMDPASAIYQHAGRVAQIVTFETGALATGTTGIPQDDTIPQNTEGDQYVSLSITPTSAASTLLIDFVGQFSHATAAQNIIAALFQDTTANALAAAAVNNSVANGLETIVLRHKMLAGTTAATTFKVRVGGNTGGAVTFNGGAGTRLFGGVSDSLLKITEVLP